MNLIEIQYFSSSNEGICGNDFKNKNKYITLNLDFLVSLSRLEKFTLPFSGNFVDNFAVITMTSGDKYYIREGQYNVLYNTINPH